jgi:hypothetical protein
MKPKQAQELFESPGSCIAIVDPAQEFQVGQPFGGRARTPVGIVRRISLVERRND